jgi:aspartyl-tRNA(Asn)/glutamyl-tRNA(Gln) amidotransferase subunit B
MSKFDNYKVNGYLPTIGIECHVQLKTKTKLFAGVGNDARGAKPNTLVSHICFGMPGALPVLNKKAIELACRAGFALNSSPSIFSKFDRKHYFYPDLPKGYQITQFDQPIILGGFVEIINNNKKKKIGITRAHLEEDAGKNTHPEGSDSSLVDLNRAGTPLLEIVSEPEIHSPQEAKSYAKELFLLMQYADVSDCDLYHGNMRFDVNVSVSNNDSLGTRTETKNLNSFKSVEKAVAYEIDRQIDLLKKGEVIIQETRGWDDAKQKTFSQRSKEEAHDYRYFPEPDIPPVVLEQSYIDNIKKTMPILPNELRDKLNHINIDKSVTDTLVEHMVAGKFMISVFDAIGPIRAKKIANWLAVDVQNYVLEDNKKWSDLTLDLESFISLETMVDKKIINSTGAKVILIDIIQGKKDPNKIAKERNLIQDSDEKSISLIVKKIIEDNPTAVKDIVKGEDKAIGYLVGQIMKHTKGRVNPKLAKDLIIETIKKSK